MIPEGIANLSDAKVNINFRKTMPILNFSKLFSNFDKNMFTGTCLLCKSYTYLLVLRQIN